MPIPADVIPSFTVGFTGSNAQVRLALSYYLAYRATRRARYLRWGDEALDALLRLERLRYSYAGREYELYAYFYRLEAPHSPLSRAEIDPNQQAFTGLTLALFFLEPRSVHFRKSELKTISIQNLDAVAGAMTPEGRLPLTVAHPDSFDTRYGHLALMLLLGANRLWGEGRYDEMLERAAGWVDEFNRRGTSARYFPAFYEGPLPDLSELYFRAPVAYLLGDRAAQRRIETTTWRRWREFTGRPEGFATPFILFDVLGIPRSAYWPQARGNASVRPE